MAPYRPFLDAPWRLAMGIKTLDLQTWIEIDEHFVHQLGERRRLLGERKEEVLAALPESGPARRSCSRCCSTTCPPAFRIGTGGTVTGSKTAPPARASSSRRGPRRRSSWPAVWSRRTFA